MLAHPAEAAAAAAARHQGIEDLRVWLRRVCVCFFLRVCVLVTLSASVRVVQKTTRTQTGTSTSSLAMRTITYMYCIYYRMACIYHIHTYLHTLARTLFSLTNIVYHRHVCAAAPPTTRESCRAGADAVNHGKYFAMNRERRTHWERVANVSHLTSSHIFSIYIRLTLLHSHCWHFHR